MQGISETIFSVIHSNENMINVKKEKKKFIIYCKCLTSVCSVN